MLGVCLYNGEIWTLKNPEISNIDIIHKKHLRNVLQLFYPNMIRNEDLYLLISEKQWGEKLETCGMRFFGHVLRLPEDTPVRKALQESAKLHRGLDRRNPKLTWHQLICNKQPQILGYHTLLQKGVTSKNDVWSVWAN